MVADAYGFTRTWEQIADALIAACQPGAQVPEYIRDVHDVEQEPIRNPNYAPPAQGIHLGPGACAIADERRRQIDAEGYSHESDAEYRDGELANAALAHVRVAAMDLSAGGRSHIATRSPPECWPWRRLWRKPRDVRRDPVRAGALIAAQIDLIDSQAVGIGQ